MRTLVRHAFAAAVAVVTTAAAAACIIADPPTDFPRPPERRPTILRDRAVPPTSQVLGTFPPDFTFLVDVEADPTANLVWHLFIDYSDFTADGPPAGLVGRGPAAAENGGADSGVREVPIAANLLTTAPDLGRCHVIEALVALGFQSEQGVSSHAFDSRGGDSIVWFYSPTGDLRGCPVYDAGTDGNVPDAEAGPPATEAGPGG